MRCDAVRSDEREWVDANTSSLFNAIASALLVRLRRAVHCGACGLFYRTHAAANPGGTCLCQWGAEFTRRGLIPIRRPFVTR